MMKDCRNYGEFFHRPDAFLLHGQGLALAKEDLVQFAAAFPVSFADAVGLSSYAKDVLDAALQDLLGSRENKLMIWDVERLADTLVDSGRLRALAVECLNRYDVAGPLEEIERTDALRVFLAVEALNDRIQSLMNDDREGRPPLLDAVCLELLEDARTRAQIKRAVGLVDSSWSNGSGGGGAPDTFHYRSRDGAAGQGPSANQQQQQQQQPESQDSRAGAYSKILTQAAPNYYSEIPAPPPTPALPPSSGLQFQAQAQQQPQQPQHGPGEGLALLSPPPVLSPLIFQADGAVSEGDDSGDNDDDEGFVDGVLEDLLDLQDSMAGSHAGTAGGGGGGAALSSTGGGGGGALPLRPIQASAGSKKVGTMTVADRLAPFLEGKEEEEEANKENRVPEAEEQEVASSSQHLAPL